MPNAEQNQLRMHLAQANCAAATGLTILLLQIKTTPFKRWTIFGKKIDSVATDEMFRTAILYYDNGGAYSLFDSLDSTLEFKTETCWCYASEEQILVHVLEGETLCRELVLRRNRRV